MKTAVPVHRRGADRLLRRCRLWLLPAVPALLLLCGYRLWPSFADRYQRTVYPLLSACVSRLSGLLPVSLAELFLAGCVLAALILLGWVLAASRRCPGFWRRLSRALLIAADVCAVLLLLFALFCGAGYYSDSFSQREGFVIEPADAATLTALCHTLVDRTLAVEAQLPRDENGLMQIPAFDEMSDRARTAMSALAETYPSLDTYYPRAKPVLLSKAMSHANITGIYTPYTVEANVNRDIPAYKIPAVICHELSHLSGFMREDEANFIAYLAGSRSGDAPLAYSSLMLALVYSTNALAGADYEAYVEVMQRYTPGMRVDVLANMAYWKQFEGPVAEVSTAVNDGYLKVNAQQDGVRSYGRVVDLLLAEYRMQRAL